MADTGRCRRISHREPAGSDTDLDTPATNRRLPPSARFRLVEAAPNHCPQNFPDSPAWLRLRGSTGRTRGTNAVGHTHRISLIRRQPPTAYAAAHLATRPARLAWRAFSPAIGDHLNSNALPTPVPLGDHTGHRPGCSRLRGCHLRSTTSSPVRLPRSITSLSGTDRGVGMPRTPSCGHGGSAERVPVAA